MIAALMSRSQFHKSWTFYMHGLIFYLSIQRWQNQSDTQVGESRGRNQQKFRDYLEKQ